MTFTAGGSQGSPAFFAISWSLPSWNARSSFGFKAAFASVAGI